LDEVFFFAHRFGEEENQSIRFGGELWNVLRSLAVHPVNQLSFTSRYIRRDVLLCMTGEEMAKNFDLKHFGR
jgi:hypothetical protein